MKISKVSRASRGRARSRKVIMQSVIRWALYSAVMLLLYVLECCPIIEGFSPLLLIPLAAAVAMFEGELSAGIFGAVCGLMMDSASGVIIGFSAFWMVLCCPFVSLLSRFWLKVNAVSHLFMTAAIALITGYFDFMFIHWVWEGSLSSISFQRSILPAYAGAVVLAIPVYLLTRAISKFMRPKEERRLEESAQSAEETDEQSE